MKYRMWFLQTAIPMQNLLVKVLTGRFDTLRVIPILIPTQVVSNLIHVLHNIKWLLEPSYGNICF